MSICLVLDIIYQGNMDFKSVLSPNKDPSFDDIVYMCDIGDCRKNGLITDKIMNGISFRLLRVTKMNPIPRYITVQLTSFLTKASVSYEIRVL